MKFRSTNFGLRIALLACLSATQATFAQAPAQSNNGFVNTGSIQRVKTKGSITGRVVADDGQPVGGAGVVAMPVTGNGRGIQRVHCDVDGNFKFTDLSASAYFLFTEVPGFVLERGALETPHRLGENVTLSLTRGGAITGRVTDANGEPLVASRVFARRLRTLGGEAEDPNALVRIDSRNNTRLTDDRGMYRIFGLAAGVYVVYVQAGFGYAPGITEMGNEVPTYHPSSAREAAAEISVPEGAEIIGIDIRHRADRGHSISGTVVGSGDNTMAVIAMLRNLASGQIEAYTYFGGTPGFAFYAVPDGEYELTTLQPSPRNAGNEQGLSASLPRRVTMRGANVAGLELKLARLGAISGRVFVEKLSPGICPLPAQPVRAESVLLHARADQPEAQPLHSGLGVAVFGEMIGEAAPEANGEFHLPNLRVGRYRIEANLPNEMLYLRSITQAQSSGDAGKKTEAARFPITLKQSEKLTGIEITVAEGAATLTGRVTTSEGKRLPKRMLVHLIPVEASAADDVLRYCETAPNEDGSFAFQHLVPGKYWLLAHAATETEIKKTSPQPLALDAGQRAKLRREAETAKNKIALAPCQRAKDVMVKADGEK